ncbi:hypothetical protein LCGC14_2300910 [marine sediment metagenome]|uniref:DNA cytosine methyltransferase n=1 Tax=marine sediment metagenome TaxID=412755 RepID=A0A0F9DB05_9ZZZZ
MKILVACERSGIVREAFRARGHEAWSCDLEPSDTSRPFCHVRRDALEVIHDMGPWDLLIAHPPCTYLCNSGVRWLKDDPVRWGQLNAAATFFRRLIECDIPKICIENPIPHKYAVERIGKKYDQLIQPWQFGHGETKATCLWLNSLPELQPTKIVEGREGRIWKMPPGPHRAYERSKTYSGIANAMAAQWGGGS